MIALRISSKAVLTTFPVVPGIETVPVSWSQFVAFLGDDRWPLLFLPSRIYTSTKSPSARGGRLGDLKRSMRVSLRFASSSI